MSLLVCKIKNISGEIQQLHLKEFIIDEIYDIPSNEQSQWANNDDVIIAISNRFFEIHNENGPISSISDQINWLKRNTTTVVDAKVISQPPFSEPMYRTKRNATSDPISCPANETVEIDYLITEERFVFGGEIIIKNAEFGDFLTASVYDRNSVIPELYRATVCENWPTVSEYIEKQWIPVSTGNITVQSINTYPLNAKITSGLFLRITYSAANCGINRDILVNYYLTKKI
jgi:hypothetical protein